ncbi:MAG: FAD-dependent oxidoreductase [Deltaproteobacteria bacterium]|nr:FAD-dependent oxidoreductase [Deltaproteobacteria bacterium]
MTKQTQTEKDTQNVLEEQAHTQLIEVFRKMPHEVPLVLFTQRSRNDIFGDAVRHLIRSIREITPKISLLEFDLKHKLAKKYAITHAPTLLFDPEHYRVRWLGAPVGEEARTFIEALIMMGYRDTMLTEDSRQVLEKIDTPRDMKIFVSSSCPYCPQQAVNGLKAAIEKPGLISLEIIDIQVNPELADQYAAFSVPQVFANDILIAPGTQPEELFMLSLQRLEQQTVFIPESDAEEVQTEVVIVGGGPAGLTAGIYTARSGLQSVIIEREALGGQVATTPIIENYPGFNQVGGKTLVDIMVNHALEYVNIFPNEEVVDIRPGDPMEVLTTRRRFTAKALLLATGAVHRHLNVTGESRLSGRGVSYCSTCDGPLFKGKKAIILGGGNSAVTEALNLHHIGVDVTLIHRRGTLRAQEHLVKSLYADNIPVIFDTEVKEIRGKAKVREVVLFNTLTRKTEIMPVDGVFVAIGYEPAVELAKKIGVELTPEGYIKHDERHRTSIPGIYAAGDVEGGYKQIVTAAGQGSEAAIAIFEDLTNPYWKRKAAVDG